MNNFLLLLISLTLVRPLHKVALETKCGLLFFHSLKKACFSAYYLSYPTISTMVEVSADSRISYKTSRSFQSPPPLSASTIQYNTWQISGSHTRSNDFRQGWLDHTTGKEHSLQKKMCWKNWISTWKRMNFSQAKNSDILIKKKKRKKKGDIVYTVLLYSLNDIVVVVSML